MDGYFWTNTIWYLALFCITITEFVIILLKADNRKFIVSFISSSIGLFYLFEYFLVAIADAYQYHPMIIADDSFQDTVFGNIFSQTSIAVTCALVIVLRLRSFWYFIIAVAYYLIELLFVRLRIYELHWYKTIFTPIILIPLIWAIRKWHNYVVLSNSRSIENLLIFLSALAIAGNLVIMPLKLAKIQIFTGHFFSDMSRDHTTTVVLYLTFIIGSLIAVYKAKIHAIWKASIIVGLYIIQYCAYKAGLMVFRNGWFIWATLFEISLFMLWIRIVDKLIRVRRPTYDGMPKL